MSNKETDVVQLFEKNEEIQQKPAQPTKNHGPADPNKPAFTQEEKQSIHPHQGHHEQGQVIGHDKTVTRDQERTTFGSGSRYNRNKNHHKP